MVSVIIVAAGSSARMNGVNKQLEKIDGTPVFVMSALKFERSEKVGEIIIAAPESETEHFEKLAREHGVSKLAAVVAGGETRMRSVRNCLERVSPNADHIAIHDGARPLIETAEIERVFADAEKYGAAIAAVPAVDTIKEAGSDGDITGTPPRGGLYYAQTPQVFSKELYLSCLRKAENTAADKVTDDAGLLEMCGERVRITEISGCNMKITHPEDLVAAAALYRGRRAGGSEGAMRIGHGYDVHRLVPDRRLVLCGVEIPYELGLLGHSDADVAVHALMDAVLGALALGDIGHLFPDSDPQFKNADSMVLLREVIGRMNARGFTLGNLDLTITAERPKLAPYIERMRENLAKAFDCEISRVSVKATTEEGLGLAGDGIGANAVVLLS